MNSAFFISHINEDFWLPSPEARSKTVACGEIFWIVAIPHSPEYLLNIYHLTDIRILKCGVFKKRSKYFDLKLSCLVTRNLLERK